MNRRLILLGSVAALLAAFVLVDGQWPLSQLTGPETMDATPDAPPAAVPAGSLELNPLEGLAAQSFTALHERPLFNPGRTPRPAEPPPPPPPPAPEEPPPPPPVVETPSGPNPEDFQLLAIAAGPKGRVAALRVSETGEVLYLREGQPVLNWTMLAVGDRKVTIGTPEASIDLGLFEAGATGETAEAPEPQPEPPPEQLLENPSPMSPGSEMPPANSN